MLSEALSFTNKSRNHFHASLFILAAALVCSFAHAGKEVLRVALPLLSFALPTLYFFIYIKLVS